MKSTSVSLSSTSLSPCLKIYKFVLRSMQVSKTCYASEINKSRHFFSSFMQKCISINSLNCCFKWRCVVRSLHYNSRGVISLSSMTLLSPKTGNKLQKLLFYRPFSSSWIFIKLRNQESSQIEKDVEIPLAWYSGQNWYGLVNSVNNRDIIGGPDMAQLGSLCARLNLNEANTEHY